MHSAKNEWHLYLTLQSIIYIVMSFILCLNMIYWCVVICCRSVLFWMIFFFYKTLFVCAFFSWRISAWKSTRIVVDNFFPGISSNIHLLAAHRLPVEVGGQSACYSGAIIDLFCVEARVLLEYLNWVAAEASQLDTCSHNGSSSNIKLSQLTGFIACHDVTAYT